MSVFDHLRDPMEREIANALATAGYDFVRHEKTPTGSILDFYVPALDLFIEVKQYHSERIGRQIAGLENVLVIQGKAAAAAFAQLLKREKPAPANRSGLLS